MNFNASLKIMLWALILMLSVQTARAEELLMVRIERPFDDAINDLQIAIQEHGYQVARIQRVDVGLASGGYATAEYRLVFFGKPAEMREIEDRYPQLLPYLPLKIVIFAEGNSALALSYNPALLQTFFKIDPLQSRVQQWEKDIRSILNQLSRP
ncbi:MAG: DUF302 domain-containing protein [Gammaproteobacteria bacterium]|nr:DUF302 domain-containing protein [Gammaproteobacteria bacterium]